MSLQLNGTNGVTYNDGTLQSSAPVGRNLIINGNMAIAQRGTSVGGLTSFGYYTIDRMFANFSLGTWTMSQDTDVPTGQGFSNSLKANCTTSASLSASSQVGIETRLEGLNCQQLAYGTANAKSTTLSFWVKSNKTGTYTAEFFISDDTRSISNTFTINSADTWEKKTITVVGDTVGVIDNDNGLGMLIKIWLAAGSDWTSGTLNTSWSTRTNANVVSSSNVNLADNTANYINITGVQLETGTTATDFEHRPYDMELQRCQRYYWKLIPNASAVGDSPGIVTSNWNTVSSYGYIPFPVSMRTNPTLSYSSASDFASLTAGTAKTVTGITSTGPLLTGSDIWSQVASGLTAGWSSFLRFNASGAYISYSAEL
jgi:hypothetical protein